MSAVPLLVPPVSVPRGQTLRPAAVAPATVAPATVAPPIVAIARPATIAQPAITPARWRLTDRGMGVVMVVAAMILTAALVVIGLTAVRVTSPDYGSDFDDSRQAQR